MQRINLPRYTNYVTFLIIAPILLLIGACSTNEDNEQPNTLDNNQIVEIVTSSNIVGDWIKAIGQDHVSVSSLFPPGADPHTYTSGPQDVAKITDASLIFTVGAEFESPALQKLFVNAVNANTAQVIELGKSVDLLEYDDKENHDDHDDHECDEDDHSGQGHGEFDPHYWVDPVIAENLIKEISHTLIEFSPEHREDYERNAENYLLELRQLHTWINDQVKQIPEGQAVLITAHDSLQYFANRYGFEVLGAVIPDFSTEEEVTPADIKEIIEIIEEHAVPAIFADVNENSSVARMISQETGATFVGNLHVGSLGAPGTETETYIKLMKVNVRIIVDALT
ncbi:metal ABC transporter substrate-binding protein [Dehalococcoidia bacterium]|nr:metal ABC transporter substrate-binding protein [Dehalococcoidia bacterium]